MITLLWLILSVILIGGSGGGRMTMAFSPPSSSYGSSIFAKNNGKLFRRAASSYQALLHASANIVVDDTSPRNNHVRVGRNTYYRVSRYAPLKPAEDLLSRDDIVSLSSKSSNSIGSSSIKQHSDNIMLRSPTAVFDKIVNARYACTRFERYQEDQAAESKKVNGDNHINTTFTTQQQQQQQPTASISNPSIVQASHDCIELSQRAPTGFNAQPYRVILVHSKDDKEQLALYCLGRNADRVRDSDCTAVFLADRECGRDGKRFTDFLVKNMDSNNSTVEVSSIASSAKATSRTRRPLSQRALFKLRMLIVLFSSGYPLPQFLSIPISFGIRTGVSILSFFARCLYSLQRRFKLFAKILPNNIQLLPTLFSSTTWSQKNTMLIAMTYMLACTSRGLATCPMEGIDASGVRKVLGIPRGRYTIPLIVSAGVPYHRKKDDYEEEETDDVGVSHGSEDMSPRYPLNEVVYDDAYGIAFASG